VFSGRILCDGPITRPEEPFQVWCVAERDREASIEGLSSHGGGGERLSLRRPRYLSRCNDSLQDGRSGHRIPVGKRISVPVQESPETHPTSNTMVIVFSADRAAGECADPPPPPLLPRWGGLCCPPPPPLVPSLRVVWCYTSSSPVCSQKYFMG